MSKNGQEKKHFNTNNMRQAKKNSKWKKQKKRIINQQNIKIEDIAIEEDEETHPGLASVKYLQSL